MSIILEGSNSPSQEVTHPESSASTSQPVTSSPLIDEDINLPDVDILKLDPRKQQILDRVQIMATEGRHGLTQREWATVLVIGVLLQSDQDDVLGARAMLLHTVVLGQCKLSERAVTLQPSERGESFLAKYVIAMIGVLSSELWKKTDISITGQMRYGGCC